MIRSIGFLGGALLALGSLTSAQAQLRVGAAKVDITPDAANLPEPYQSVHDPLYTRAILVEGTNGAALLMNLDVGMIPSSFGDELAGELSAKYAIPRENILISAVHVHSSTGNLGGAAPGSSGPTPAMQAFVAKVHKGMMLAAEQAHNALQPAEMGFGTGSLALNVNRDSIDPKTRLWVQGPNPEGPSDKTLAVLEFRRPYGGAPIAVYMNYAMHAVTMFLRGDISGDFPEVASQTIESVYDDEVVAMFSSGAAGDQNPLFMRPILAINEARIRNEMDPAKPNDPAEQNGAIMRLFLGGQRRPELPLDPKLAAQSWKVVEAIGTLMAEETMRVMALIPYFSNSALVQGSSTVVACPGRRRLDNAREGYEGRYEDGPAVSVSVGALRLGDVAIGYVNGEPYNRIGQEVKAGSPFAHTMVVTLAAGGSGGGYMPTDDTYGHYTFQALGTRFKPGCAEMGIVHGIDGLLYKDFNTAP